MQKEWFDRFEVDLTLAAEGQFLPIAAESAVEDHILLVGHPEDSITTRSNYFFISECFVNLDFEGFDRRNDSGRLLKKRHSKQTKVRKLM